MEIMDFVQVLFSIINFRLFKHRQDSNVRVGGEADQQRSGTALGDYRTVDQTDRAQPRGEAAARDGLEQQVRGRAPGHVRGHTEERRHEQAALRGRRQV